MNQAQDVADKLRSLYSGVWDRLRSLPGVAGLGIGTKGWRIYVEPALTDFRCEKRYRLPSRIAGFPAEVVEKQTSFLCYGNDFQATLKPGLEIASKGQEGGSLGCFARDRSNTNTIVLISNSHVLYGDIADMGGSGNGNDCGQPSVSCCCCCTSHVIGQNRGNGANAFNRVHVHVTHPQLPASDQEQSGSEIDCAAAILNNNRPYTNQSEFYGMIAGAPASGLGVSAGDAVQKVGSTTGYTTGTLLEFTFNATYVSGGSGTVPSILLPLTVGGGRTVEESFSGARGNINQFVVVPDPDPQNASRKTFFVRPGDSGSVVINSARQVIGLVTRMVQLDQEMIDYLNAFLTHPLPPHAGNLGVVCPIGKVLDSLGVEIVNNMQGTAPSAGAVLEVPDELLQRREKVIALERTLQDLEQEIRQKPLGRKVLDKIKEHRPEAARLVEQNRAVKVAWHRCQGPAYAAHCLHSFEDRGYKVPPEVNGVSVFDLVQRMAQVLKTYGSDRLRVDIQDHEQLACEWISGCDSVWQLVDRVRRLGTDDVHEVTTNAGVS